ncbi:hypothetical protein [Evansella cellulosilytica]|uniref:Uncharacterized protein n=1 Tax=Evansella cellulosilytica (strain ATCC 21833 / DSM 2522 / FERM P-1141 / JCM 9156 / N-4) TaxID=649639 RepID=E6TUM5_EVAC2|nr:hypothetical protein [Evansella cellulosilytica]ADU30915.1 hypothetical protein Bcell_2660 [Evansella cellulosilytica DSM 2522]
MKKSDFLDELRLEVGLAYDYAQNSKDFLLKVIDTLYDFHLDKRCVFTIFYTNCNDDYVPLYILGEKNYNSKVNMGIGFISLCARNIAVFVKKDNEQTILAPIYIDDELKYVISVTM